MISWDGGVFQHFRVRVGYGEHVNAVYCKVFVWRKFKYYSVRLSLMLIYVRMIHCLSLVIFWIIAVINWSTLNNPWSTKSAGRE